MKRVAITLGLTLTVLGLSAVAQPTRLRFDGAQLAEHRPPEPLRRPAPQLRRLVAPGLALNRDMIFRRTPMSLRTLELLRFGPPQL